MANYGARGASAAWLGQALMDLASRKRGEKQQQSLLARDDQRYAQQLSRMDAADAWMRERAGVEDQRYTQGRDDDLAAKGAALAMQGVTGPRMEAVNTPSFGTIAPSGDAAKLMGGTSPSAVGKALMDFAAPKPLESNIPRSVARVGGDVNYNPSGDVDLQRTLAADTARTQQGLAERLRQVGALKGAGIGGQRLAVFEATGQLPAEREPQQPRSVWSATPDGRAFNTVTGEFRGEAVPKPASSDPVTARTMREDVKLIEEIDVALKGLDAHPGAVGMKKLLPEAVNQRIDPNGVPVRAAIANVGSLITLARSGGAVSDAEFARIAPFIPRDTDSGEAVRKKLEYLREWATRRTGGSMMAPAAPGGGDDVVQRYGLDMGGQ